MTKPAHSTRERFLVTGALGCIGAWVVRRLLDEGVGVVVYDLGTSDHRLRLVLDDGQLERLVRVAGDITSLDQLERTLDGEEITNVVHLAALQVPFCKEAPPLGAAVNVVGTVNVFEAVKRRRERMAPVVYASSAAVYGPARTAGTAPEETLEWPGTHYGVYKVANEGNARVYWADDGVASIGLRPYVVYGPGRDQGVTSSPTAAMLAAARGESFHIPFGGRTQFHYAPDVAAALIAASRSGYEGALVANVPAPAVEMRDVVAAIEAAAPGAAVGFDDVQLPFPEELQADALEAAIGPVRVTPLAEGVRETIEHFRARAAVPA
ncbi:MAG TPA: NAD(P)-dependent oxidoreductase [Gaiellaceae bacterium]|nr:NAD(P)-dependent oxidoreductase [Gaiellaceae bacterium]